MIKNTYEEEYQTFGGIKIKDGLFWGDYTAAEDSEFLEINKITYIINCNSKENPFLPKNRQIFQKDLKWVKNDATKIFIIFSKILPEIEKILNQVEKKYESILIFCDSGENRSFSIMVCFLMKRYNWSLYKAIQYIDNKKPKIEIKKSFYKSLIETARNFEEKKNLSKNWTKNDFFSELEFREEEKILRNTFLNSINSGKGFKEDFGILKNLGKKKILGNFKNLKLTKSLDRKCKKSKIRLKWADRIFSKSLKKKKKNKIK